MKIRIKELGVAMELKNKALELAVYSSNGKKHLGDFSVNRKYIIWSKGRTTRDNGIKILWPEFIKWIESQRKAD